MAQNDTHVALIILTTQMWGGGGGIIGGKNFFGPNLVFLCLWRQHPFLHKTKGPTRNPISPTPPPSLLRRASMSPPPRRAIFRLPWKWAVDLDVCMHLSVVRGWYKRGAVPSVLYGLCFVVRGPLGEGAPAMSCALTTSPRCGGGALGIINRVLGSGRGSGFGSGFGSGAGT